MDQQTIDNNKLIAEFDGWTPHPTLKEVYIKGDIIMSINPLAISRFNYDNDWNLLMPVVDKINRIVDIHDAGSAFGSYGIGIRYNQIKPAHKAVVEFINWYNKKGK